MDEETESSAPLIALIILFIGAAFITVGAVFLTYGLYVLIRTGTWPHYPVSRLLDEVGIPSERLAGDGGHPWLAWLLDQSACVALLAVGALIGAAGVWLIARYNRRRAAAAAEAGTAAI